MTTPHAIQTIVEIIIAAAIIAALFNENKIVAFEKRIFNKIAEVIRKQ
jgi:flagellar biosynthesis protein FliQ